MGVNLVLIKSHILGAEGYIVINGALKELIFGVLEAKSDLEADAAREIL